MDRGELPSKTSITISESLSDVLDFSTPIFSTVSLVSLIPAVSVITIGIPSSKIDSSITSLVVPGISVTIALFSSSSAFKRELLPTFGFPAITILIPSLIIFPLLELYISESIFLLLSIKSFIRAMSELLSKSSSGKSKVTSIFAKTFKISFRSSLIFPDSLPLL